MTTRLLKFQKENKIENDGRKRLTDNFGMYLNDLTPKLCTIPT